VRVVPAGRPLAQRAEHEETCTLVPRTCPNCNEKMPQHKLEHHQQRCPLRQVLCKWVCCGRMLPQRDRQQHHKVCKFRIVGCTWCKAMLPHHEIADHRTCCAMRPICCQECDVTIMASADGGSTSDTLYREHMLLRHWLPQMEALIKEHCKDCTGCDEVKFTSKQTCEDFQRQMRQFQNGHCDHNPHANCATCKKFTHLMNNHSSRCPHYRSGEACTFPVCPNYSLPCFWKGCTTKQLFKYRRDHEQICSHKLLRCPHCPDSDTLNFHIMTPMQLKDHMGKCRLAKLQMLSHVQSCSDNGCTVQVGVFRCGDLRAADAHYAACRSGDPLQCSRCLKLADLDPDIATTRRKRACSKKKTARQPGSKVVVHRTE
jgi:hypothetical protein